MARIACLMVLLLFTSATVFLTGCEPQVHDAAATWHGQTEQGLLGPEGNVQPAQDGGAPVNLTVSGTIGYLRYEPTATGLSMFSRSRMVFTNAPALFA